MVCKETTGIVGDYRVTIQRQCSAPGGERENVVGVRLAKTIAGYVERGGSIVPDLDPLTIGIGTFEVVHYLADSQRRGNNRWEQKNPKNSADDNKLHATPQEAGAFFRVPLLESPSAAAELERRRAGRAVPDSRTAG